MAEIKFYKANALPASPTSADDGIWLIADGANNYKHFVITGGVVRELTVTGAGGGSAEWGQITGTLADQTDLQNALNAKANDNAVVKLTGNQTVGGTKTFSTSPVVPSKNSAAANTPTAIATEAQVFLKANDADVVKLTGNQTVAGVKTFSEFPVTPSSAPTSDYQAANKKYVDDQIEASVLEWSTDEW